MSHVSLLRVLTEDGNPTSERLTENHMHARDHWHSCLCVCVTDGQGNIYLSKRGRDTAIAPGKLDMFLVTDHVVVEDQTLQHAVLRALRQRIGVNPLIDVMQDDLVYSTRSEYWVTDVTFPPRDRYYQGYWHRAFERIFVVCIPGLMTDPTISLHLQEGRIDSLRLYPMELVAYHYRMPPDSVIYDQYMHRPPDEENIILKVEEAVKRLRYS
jgi:hypothetical protein